MDFNHTIYFVFALTATGDVIEVRQDLFPGFHAAVNHFLNFFFTYTVTIADIHSHNP